MHVAVPGALHETLLLKIDHCEAIPVELNAECILPTLSLSLPLHHDLHSDLDLEQTPERSLLTHEIQTRPTPSVRLPVPVLDADAVL